MKYTSVAVYSEFFPNLPTNIHVGRAPSFVYSVNNIIISLGHQVGIIRAGPGTVYSHSLPAKLAAEKQQV